MAAQKKLKLTGATPIRKPKPFKLTPPPYPTESAEQCAYFAWVDLQKHSVPALRLVFHVPNGGSRHKIEAVNLKRQGVRAGVPDIILPVPRQFHTGLAIEFKRKGEGREKALTDKQVEWRDGLIAEGWQYHCLDDAGDAITATRNYLGMNR